jgi:hypothetical protein
VGITLKGLYRAPDPARRQLRVGIHHQHQVLGRQPGQDPPHRLIQRPGLAGAVPDRDQHFRAVQDAPVIGGVRGVVADHDDLVRRAGLAPQGVDRLLDRRRLVVGRDQHDHPAVFSRCIALVLAGMGRVSARHRKNPPDHYK